MRNRRLWSGHLSGQSKLKSGACITTHTQHPSGFTLHSQPHQSNCLGPAQQQRGSSNYPQTPILFSLFGFLVCGAESHLPSCPSQISCFLRVQREDSYPIWIYPETKTQTENSTSPYSCRLTDACPIVLSSQEQRGNPKGRCTGWGWGEVPGGCPLKLNIRFTWGTT